MSAADIIITVHGSAWADIEPEQCTVRFTIATDGPDRAPVVERVTADLSAMSAVLSSLEDSGAVDRWSADRVQVSAQRPWTSDGTQAPIVHRSSVSGLAIISDLTAVAELVDALAEHETASVDSLEWSLTDARLEFERTQVRISAVGDAVAKAEVLATAIALGSVTAVALADPGMLDGGAGGTAPRLEKSMMAMSAPGGGLSLRPEPIRVEVAVDARFVARPSVDVSAAV